MLALHLPPEIEGRLEALVGRTGRSKDDHARDAILEHLEALEVAEQRLAAVYSGEGATVFLDDLMSRYGVAD